MNTQEIKELLTGVITNLESPQPQQWSPEWIAKLKILQSAILEPRIDALNKIEDFASDYYEHEHDSRFAEIYNIAAEANGATRRIVIDNE